MKVKSNIMNDYSNLPTEQEYRELIGNPYCYGETIYSEPKYKCPKCGGGMCRNETIILMSYPPQRQYECNKCGYVNYQYM
jgi:hypothetical protein